MGIGTGTSIICALLIDKLKIKMNEKGVKDSNGVVGSYLIPGLIAGILSAIFHAPGVSPSYSNSDNSFGAWGGIQVAGFVIAIGLGLFAGAVSGILMRIFNSREAEDQFNPNLIVTETPLREG
jgi:ammonia channel protein AmtB